MERENGYPLHGIAQTVHMSTR